MNKKTLIKVVENIEYFEGYNSPQEIYLNLGTYSDFQSILKVMNGKDVMLFCFLTYERRFLVDLSKLYDFIISNYSEFTIGEILNHNPNKECYQCDGGGNVGCTQCYGDGEVDCSDCGGDGELECNICDGEGEIKAVNETLVKMTRYLSYDINFTKKFENMEVDEVISPEFYNRLMNRKKFLVINDFDYLFEDYEHLNYKKMEEGDVFLVHEKSQPKLKHSSGKISVW